LEYTEITLSLPDEYFPIVPEPDTPPKWFFENHTAASLADLIGKCDLTSVQKSTLMDKRRWQTETNGINVLVPPEVVLTLNPPARQQIYAVLAQSQVNASYCYPFRFSLKEQGQMFAHTRLEPNKEQMARSLIYTNGGTLCLADMDILRHVFSTEEIREVLKYVYRTPTLIMKLRVTPESDINSLVRYWGVQGRARIIKPVLESLAKSAEGGTLNRPKDACDGSRRKCSSKDPLPQTCPIDERR